MVGNFADAERASRCPKDYILSDIGTTRMVYLINNVVYKVATDGENEWEYRQFLKFSTGNLPENVRVPEMSIYYIDGEAIIAAELITGQETGECNGMMCDNVCDCDGECMPAELLNTLRRMGWMDTTFGNAILSDGIYYLVDIAC